MPPASPLQLGADLQAVESRRDVRIVLSLPARYTLANRRDVEGKRREFNGRVINMSCQTLAMMGPAIGEMGERVMAHVDEFGKFEGLIVRVLEGAFMMEIVAPAAERARLAGKIAWYDKFKNHDVDDQRIHPRIVPRNPHSTLVFADGTTMDCLVINVSATGAALSADVLPPVGAVVAVGKVVGRVVRHLPAGFAVMFAQVQDIVTIETAIARH